MNRTGAQFNRVSGRKEYGSAVTAKVYTLGNSFELSGRDFYEKDRRESQAIKENRLNLNEQRRRANRARAMAEKQSARSQAHQGRIVDRFGYQKVHTDGPGPTSASVKAPQPLPGAKQDKPKSNRLMKRTKPASAGRAARTRGNNVEKRGTGHRISSSAHGINKKGQYKAEPAASVRARVAKDEIGIAISEEERQHATSLALARRMQRGGENSRNGGSPRIRSANRRRQSPRTSAAYQQSKNTREPDEYLSLLLGKDTRGTIIPPKSTESSPGTVARAKQLEKELARRRRLLELEQGLGDRIIARSEGANEDADVPLSPRSRQMRAASNRRKHQIANRKSSRSHGKEDNQEGSDTILSGARNGAPFDTEPVARRINRRKEMEKRKIMDGNVNRLIRAVKSGIVELQLCVWEWEKEKTFKSKDVARSRRVSLRRKLHRLLEDHRRAVVELVAAVRNWQSERGMESFVWNDLDIMDLLRRMPSIPGASSEAARTYAPGTQEAYESEFGLGFLGESDRIVGFLDFAVGDGDIVQRLDGTSDCNLFLLTPQDRIRAARLLGENAEAEHLARSLLYGSNKSGSDEDDDENNSENDEFPFSCPEDMPLVCRICHAGERGEDGTCPNCGHIGGANWRELDEEARVKRFAEEREWFEEDKQENIRRKAEEKQRKNNKGAKGTAKSISDIKYVPKISDRDLLRFAKVQRVVLAHQLATLQTTHSSVLTSPHRNEMAESKYQERFEEEEEGKEDGPSTFEEGNGGGGVGEEDMEKIVEDQMMEQLRILQQQDKESVGDHSHYEQKDDFPDDEAAEDERHQPARGISEEKSIYEEKDDDPLVDQAYVPSEDMPESNSYHEQKMDPAIDPHAEKSVFEGKVTEGSEVQAEEDLTDIDKQFAELQQEISVEAKTQDPAQLVEQAQPTLSTFASDYYEDLKNESIRAAVERTPSESKMEQRSQDNMPFKQEAMTNNRDNISEEGEASPSDDADGKKEGESSVEVPINDLDVIEVDEESDLIDETNEGLDKATDEIEQEGKHSLEAVSDVEVPTQAPVRKAIAFVVGGADDLQEDTTPPDGADSSAVDEAKEEIAEARPPMASILGEAAPVQQPTIQERRLAALAAAERRAAKK